MKKILLFLAAICLSLTAFAQYDGLWETDYVLGQQDLNDVWASTSTDDAVMHKAGQAGSGNATTNGPAAIKEPTSTGAENTGTSPVGPLAIPFALMLAAYGCTASRKED